MNIVIAKLNGVKEGLFTDMVEAADYIDAAVNAGVLDFAIKVKNHDGIKKILHFNAETKEWEENPVKKPSIKSPFTDMEVLFLLRNWEDCVASDKAKARWCSDNGEHEEARKWRDCAEISMNMVHSYERSITMKKAYLFG